MINIHCSDPYQLLHPLSEPMRIWSNLFTKILLTYFLSKLKSYYKNNHEEM